MIMVDFEKIRVFYHVALEGSILRATSALNLSSPAISKHVSDLEKHLGARLFIRKKKGLVLTESGEKLYDVAKHSIRSLEAVTQEIEGTNVESQDELRILTTTGVVSVLLMQRMKKFVEKNPQVKIRIYTQDDNFNFFSLGVDCAILPKIDNHEGLTVRKIGSLNFVYYASQSYLAQYGMPKSLEDIKNHRVMSFYLNHQGYVGNVDWHLKGENGEELLKPTMTINNALTTISAASEGYGMVMLPRGLNLLNALDFTEVLPDKISRTFDYFYAVRNDEPETSLLQEFYQCLMESEQEKTISASASK